MKKFIEVKFWEHPFPDEPQERFESKMLINADYILKIEGGFLFDYADRDYSLVNEEEVIAQLKQL